MVYKRKATTGEKLLYIYQKRNHKSYVYNLSVVFKCTNQLDVSKLKHTCDIFRSKNDILKSNFIEKDGEVFVCPNDRYDEQYLHIEYAKNANDAMHRIELIQKKPLNLSCDCLASVYVIECGRL